MRKRIFAFVMAVIVAVGCVGYRPQKAYANAIALSSEGFEVLFGLLGSAGVVVGIDKTVESRFEEGQKLFDSLSSSQQQSYIDWLAAGEFVTSDTGHRVFQPDMELDTSWYRGLWQSVSDVCSTSISYAPPVAGLQSYSLPKSGAGDFYSTPKVLGTCKDSPFFVRTTEKSSEVFALLPSGYYLYYYVQHSTGAVTVMKFDTCALNTELTLKLEYRTAEGVAGGHYSLGALSANNFGTTSTISFSADPAKPSGVAWGDSAGGFVCGTLWAGAMTYYDGAVVGVNELIPCDTWVSKWDDAKAEGRQVGIITGQDLSGYNTLDDIYNPDTGLVTGLDVPEIPVTPDLTGIAGGLSSILNWLKSLPRTIVGQGALDFSKFNNIPLSGVFPFCIPFDLINVFKSFNGVQPIEPKWVIDLSATPLKSGGQIVLDLTQFGVWVSIIRYFCYASFVVGLILITRKVIKG